MNTSFPDLSVLEISRLCGVARSTVSYWISKKGLPAIRSGKKYVVSQDDLILFLKSQGYGLPECLEKPVESLVDRPRRACKRCWEYWDQKSEREKCSECNVFKSRIDECFVFRFNSKMEIHENCNECQYYGEYYKPLVNFIYQIEKPSAIYKGLYLWAGNHSWAKLFGTSIEYLIGAGIEEFVHPDSLRMILSYNKRRKQGDASVPDYYQADMIDARGEKIGVNVLISPLMRPSGTWLALIEKGINPSFQ